MGRHTSAAFRLAREAASDPIRTATKSASTASDLHMNQEKPQHQDPYHHLSGDNLHPLRPSANVRPGQPVSEPNRSR